MKIHYNEEFNCFETTECHKTDNIELDGVRLIPISELEKIKAEIQEEIEDYLMEVDYIRGVKDGFLFSAEIIDNHISELKGENNG